ncbi:unnamed protein product [Amoebophrya sp. A25]|nr:unnamed protein product [Amoebophrya sp. A25]|eukprot:GSA25T00013020001.1
MRMIRKDRRNWISVGCRTLARVTVVNREDNFGPYMKKWCTRGYCSTLNGGFKRGSFYNKTGLDEVVLLHFSHMIMNGQALMQNGSLTFLECKEDTS